MERENPKETVFLVDDEEEVRSTLARALRRRGYEVLPYDSAESFLEGYDPNWPGCLVLDYGLPALNGLELQTLLAEKHIAIPIIFITGHGGVPESVQAIKGGAIDFLEKPFRQSVLIDCIEKAFGIDRANRSASKGRHIAQQRFQSLTSREKEIATLMISEPSNTSSKEIGRRLDISPRTVDHHRARILEKLHIKSVAELIDLAPFVRE